MTHIHTTAGNNLYYVTLTKAGVVTSANPDVTVTGMFTQIGGSSSGGLDHENETPIVY